MTVRLFLNCFLLFLVSSSMFSCSSTKNTRYFKNIPDSGFLKTIPRVEYSAPKIQVDDILTILIQTVDPQASVNINMGNLAVANSTAQAGSGASPQVPLSGYLVDKDGFVEMAVLGRIKLAGYTTGEAKEIVLKEANKWLKQPTVIVRYANFKFSVTGEVLRPGVYVTANEKVSILDAIALAGDMTIFGKRDNVLLIRENSDGTKTPYRINLFKSDMMSDPTFYLRQNDFIYVEPGKGKAAATDASLTRTYTIIGAALSVLIILVSRIK
jgi:polysaccharide export outer membrane protein